MSNSLESNSPLQNVVKLIQQGKKQEAREMLSQLLKQDPNNADAWYLAAYIANDWDRRVRSLERALAINPKHIQARQLMAKIRVHQTEQVVDDVLYGTPPQPKAVVVREVSAPHYTPVTKRAELSQGILILVLVITAIGVVGLLGFIFARQGNFASLAALPTVALMPSETPTPSITPFPTITPLPTSTHTPVPTRTPIPSPTPSCTKEAWWKEAKPIVSEYIDISYTAARTMRISLGSIIVELGRVIRRFEGLTYPACVSAARRTILDAMNADLDGFNDFLADGYKWYTYHKEAKQNFRMASRRLEALGLSPDHRMENFNDD